MSPGTKQISKIGVPAMPSDGLVLDDLYEAIEVLKADPRRLQVRQRTESLQECSQRQLN